ncbi:MAG: ORF6N domain-containing protein [Bacteroidetes bacterium]|nr:MAG: ORF6N domain-containing protein [Bacteroidota bacterium]
MTNPYSPERIKLRIYEFRGKKVMLDRDLASLYQVATKQLKRQVRRNIERFPEDFMFELNNTEMEQWRCQIGTSIETDHDQGVKMGLRYAPFAFTEQGIAQLSSVLKSPIAIQMNIQIIRQFIKMREQLLEQQGILNQLGKLEKQVGKHDHELSKLFLALQELIHRDLSPSERTKIGY